MFAQIVQELHIFRTDVDITKTQFFSFREESYIERNINLMQSKRGL